MLFTMILARDRFPIWWSHFDLTEESKKTDLRADDAMAIEIVGAKEEVEASGINYDEFYKILKHENPLYLVCTIRILAPKNLII